MTQEDRTMLREVQKNAQMGRESIEMLANKVYDDSLAVDLSRQAYRYAQFQEKARARLEEAGQRSYRQPPMEKAMLWGGIQANTAFNTSTSHMAEMVIQGSNRGITQMCKAMNKSKDTGKFVMEMAKELMDFEEKNVERLKKYL